VAGELVYTTGEGNNSEIAIVSANGGASTLLTNNSSFDGEPDWSPNGARIAYESAASGNRDIVIMNNDGSGVQRLTTSADDDRNPDWSPNGSLIIYESGTDEDSFDLYTVNVSTGDITQLTDNDFGERAPVFSPNGSQITFMSNQNGSWQIAVADYPNLDQVQLFDCPAADCRFPIWSPDGGRIAYNTLDSTGRVDAVWVLNPSSGISTALVNEAANRDGRPSWSGDGIHVFFNRTNADGNTDLYRINRQSGLITRLTTEPANQYGPDWHPG
ncbi:MAG: hypothetical protein GYB68_14945, partial [Chloroflexi bacterium]|nr:hypothetical protein [Chloroflexota bacterium]